MPKRYLRLKFYDFYGRVCYLLEFILAWYLLDHGAINKRKPSMKLLVVLDCASNLPSRFLMQVTDLVNNLVGVLLGIREASASVTLNLCVLHVIKICL